MDTIGNRIKKLRKMENLTQNDFSKRLLISQSYLSLVESNKEPPMDKFIKMICLEFGVNESWMSSGEGEIYSPVYENEKSYLVEISNQAILKLMTLYTTKSNVEYGFYADASFLTASLLEAAVTFNEKDKLLYLESVVNLLANLERLVSVHKVAKAPASTISEHKDGVVQSLDKLCDIVTSDNI